MYVHTYIDNNSGTNILSRIIFKAHYALSFQIYYKVYYKDTFTMQQT